MHPRAFKQVDVFTATPYLGNPLAVVLDGSGLDDAAMQRFARWTNLSETTFLLPPTEPSADYWVRIFTPGGELPFAGHPTLGSCHSWLEAGGQPKNTGTVVQQCAKGLVHIRREGASTEAQLAFAAPAMTRSDPSPALMAQVANALGIQAAQIIKAQLLDNGPVWLGLLLDSVDTVLRLSPNHLELDKLQVKVGVAGVYHAHSATPLIARVNREAQAFSSHPAPPAAPAEAQADLEVRAFAAAIGINEDPVTGSLNASLAQWLMADGDLPTRYIAAQGVCLGRDGRVALTRDAASQVWVGGHTVTCMDGSVML